MDYKGIPYHAVEVHPLFKSELKWSEYKKVPVLLQADGEQVNESNVIVDVLFNQPSERSATSEKRGWFGRGRTQAAAAKQEGAGEEARWRAWADDRLVKVYTANLYRSFKESCQAMEYIFDVPAFGYVSKVGGYWSGATLMWLVGRRMPKKYGLEGKDLREELAAVIDEFVDAVGKKDFLGGKQPDRADLAVFGILRAVPNTDTFRFIMADTRIMPWWRRMVETVGESSRLEELPVK